jgi:hypothetical protein
MSLDGEANVEKWRNEAAENAPAFGRIREIGIPFALGIRNLCPAGFIAVVPCSVGTLFAPHDSVR